MKVRKSIDIMGPPVKIWPFFVEPEKLLQWYSTLKKFEYMTDQPSGLGTRIYVEEQAAGPMMKINFEVVEWKENEKLTLRMVSGSGVKSYQQSWSLEPIALGTRFTFMEEVGLPFGIMGKLIGLIGQRMSESTVNKMQHKLKALVEA